MAGRRPILVALAGTIPISFSAILFRLSETDPVTGGFFRFAYALVMLAPLGWWVRARDNRRLDERAMALAAGVLLGLDVIFWQKSIILIGTGLATLIANSQVVIVPLVTWALFRERPARAALVAMPVVMVGLAIITGLGRADTFGSRPVLGVGLATVAAALYSGFLVAFRRSNRSLAPTARPLFDATVGAACVVGFFGLVDGSLVLAPVWPGHGWLLLLALGPQVGGWIAISYALPRLPAAHTSFAILLQPVMTMVWGRLIFDEIPSLTQLSGVALVLAGIAAVTVQGSRRA
jgi:drug/metabolite transporter (DMT)-like permease